MPNAFSAFLSRRDAGLGLAMSLLALSGCAEEPKALAIAAVTAPPAPAAPVAMSIVDRDSGLPLSVYNKDSRAYVAGKPGTRYAIRLENRSAGRVLVVLSVDGVNVISGQTAAVGQSGYVLSPWRSYDISGWRKSDSSVAAFEFAALQDSYAALTGRPANVGVIGAAMFLEQAPAPRPLPQPMPANPPRSPDARLGAVGSAPQRADDPALPAGAAADTAQRTALARKSTAQMSPQTAAQPVAQPTAEMQRAPSSERLGTAYGQHEWSASSRTSFERLSSSPQAQLEIVYDSWANLVAAGVIAAPTAAAQARAFPGDAGRGFVPEPPRR